MIRQRLTVALLALLLHLGSSVAEENSSANGWLLIATQHYDDMNVVQLQCVLSHENSSVESARATSPCPHELAWFEGLTRIEDPWRVTQGGVSSVNITVSATNFGKYTCKVIVGEEELTVSTLLLPEGGTAELIKEELYGIGDEFRVNCPGDLLRLCLTNQCREFHSFTFLGNMSSLSDQSKFICFVDDTRVVNITYVLSDHQPIRLVQPQIQILSPELQDVVVIPCAATGYPAPNVTLLKWDTLNENFVNLPESVDHYFRTFSPSNISYVMTYHILLGDQGRYLCQAVNIWEKQNVTVYVHETPETNPNSCEVAPSVTPPTPKHSVMVNIRMVPVAQVGDSVQIECAFRLRTNDTTSTPIVVAWYMNGKSINFLAVSLDSAAPDGLITRSHTIEKVYLNHTAQYTCQVEVFGTSTRGSATAQLLVVDKDLVSIVSRLNNFDALVVTGPADAPTNFSALFHVHPLIFPTITAYTLPQEGTGSYLLQTITLEPQWAQGDNDTLAVWAELRPSQLADVSLRLQEEQTATLVLSVSIYNHTAAALLNITFLPPPLARPPSEDQSGLIGGLTFLMVLLLTMVTAVSILVVLTCVYRRRMEHRMESKHIQLQLVESPENRLRKKILKEVSCELLASHLLYRQEDLTVGETLGEGAFGVVCKGSLLVNGKAMSVAVKAIKDGTHLDALEEFVKELKMLQRIGRHPNIICLVGAVVKDDTLNILTEYAEGGKLLSHLHQQRGRGMLWRTKVDYGLQVARGMEYLAHMQCVHCDLAARNVLVMHDGTLKVCDFGLARKLYQELYHKNITSRTRLPLKWMALESIETHDFDSRTDVWSFGVLLWEIATLGQTPYPLWSHQELIRRLREGQRLPRPKNCPECLYTVMRSCWLPCAEDRPKFAQLVAMLNEIVVGVLPLELESESTEGLTLGVDHTPVTCPHYTTHHDSANVSNDMSLDSSGGYCSHCQTCLPQGEEAAESEDTDTGLATEPSELQLRALPRFSKMSARRLDSADSGICRNGETDLGSSSSIAPSAYSTGQSCKTWCTGLSESCCGGGNASGCTYTNCNAAVVNHPFSGWGSGVTFNPLTSHFPGHTSVHPNSLSVRHIFREQLPYLQSGTTESDV